MITQGWQKLHVKIGWKIYKEVQIIRYLVFSIIFKEA